MEDTFQIILLDGFFNFFSRRPNRLRGRVDKASVPKINVLSYAGSNPGADSSNRKWKISLHKSICF